MRWQWSMHDEPARAASEGAAREPHGVWTHAPSEDPRPVWLLDVDGVLNAHRPGWGDKVAEGAARAGGGQFWIRWSPELVERLVAIDATGAVEVRWATTWVPWIDSIEQLLGLPSWHVAWDGPYDGAGTPALPTPIRKLRSALEVVEHERRPLVWTDDDAIPSHGRERDRIVNAGVPFLLVSPATRAGLQLSDIEAIEEFVRRVG
jgi:hypothetical protein